MLHHEELLALQGAHFEEGKVLVALVLRLYAIELVYDGVPLTSARSSLLAGKCDVPLTSARSAL